MNEKEKTQKFVFMLPSHFLCKICKRISNGIMLSSPFQPSRSVAKRHIIVQVK